MAFMDFFLTNLAQIKPLIKDVQTEIVGKLRGHIGAIE